MNGEVLVWGASLAVVAAIVLPYVLSFRKRRHADRSRKEEAVRLGVDRPQAQFPFVDPMRCIGPGQARADLFRGNAQHSAVPRKCNRSAILSGPSRGGFSCRPGGRDDGGHDRF